MLHYAASSKLNTVKFNECLKEGKFKDDIEKMNEEIKGFGITGVPVYFVNGERIDGVVTYESMKAMIDKALGIEKTSTTTSSNSTEESSEDNVNNN